MCYETAQRGGGVLMSTHTLAVVEELADEVTVIDHGQIQYAVLWMSSPASRWKMSFTIDDAAWIIGCGSPLIIYL